MIEKPIVLILGDGRSGSSLLEAQLSRAFGLTALGEARWFFQRGLRDDELCSCGERFSNCAFWSQIRKEVKLENFEGAKLTGLADKLDLGSQRRVFKNFYLHVRREPGMQKLIAAAQNIWIAAEKQSPYGIIDSSKSTAYFLLLCYGTSFFEHIRVVHIVRDPRSVAASRQRIRTRVESSDPANRKMPLVGPVKSSLMWLLANFSAEIFCCLVKTATRIRYEDLVDDHQATLSSISASLDLRPRKFSGESDLYHSMSGNPTRFEADFALPTRRETGVPRFAWLVSVLTWPLRLRYGYIGGYLRQ